MICKAVAWSRRERGWGARWCLGRRRCCMPDVYPISSNGTVGRLYGVRS